MGSEMARPEKISSFRLSPHDVHLHLPAYLNSITTKVSGVDCDRIAYFLLVKCSIPRDWSHHRHQEDCGQDQPGSVRFAVPKLSKPSEAISDPVERSVAHAPQRLAACLCWFFAVASLSTKEPSDIAGKKQGNANRNRPDVVPISSDNTHRRTIVLLVSLTPRGFLRTC